MDLSQLLERQLDAFERFVAVHGVFSGQRQQAADGILF
jgi:hypothetical protein